MTRFTVYDGNKLGERPSRIESDLAWLGVLLFVGCVVAWTLVFIKFVWPLLQENKMNEPHEVSEPRDWSKIHPLDLTKRDLANILCEIAFTHNFDFQHYEIIALRLAAAILWEES